MLRRKGVQMSFEDFESYYVPAALNILGVTDDELRADDPTVHRSFDAMLGIPLCEDYVNREGYSGDAPLPDDWRDFLKSLAGPYGKAILKVYQLKNGLAHAET